jgi:uncharacterized protein (UPF0179 family)
MATDEEPSDNPNEFVTFASTSRAKVGFQFMHRGHLRACGKCQFYFVCQKSLEKYQVYEIVEVRLKKHDCPNNFHEEPMQVVKVQKLGKRVTMPKKGTFYGVTSSYRTQFCYAFECPHRQECVSTTIIFEGQKIKIKDIIRDISPECSMKHQLVLVDFDLVED